MTMSREAAMLALDEKIRGPITWDSNPKFEIQDLYDNYYEEVVTLVKHHYLREEPMCKSIELMRDRESVKQYLDLVRMWMKDTCSLVAISKKSGRVVGAILTRINNNQDRINTYSRVRLLNGECLKAIMSLKCALVRQANFYESLNEDTYLRIYLLAVHPSYKERGLGTALLQSCCLVALYMNIPYVGGIFTSSEEELFADNVGFHVHSEIRYNNWLVDDEVVFDNPGIGNYAASFMIIATPDEETLKEQKKQKEKEEKFQKILKKRRLKSKKK